MYSIYDQNNPSDPITMLSNALAQTRNPNQPNSPTSPPTELPGNNLGGMLNMGQMFGDMFGGGADAGGAAGGMGEGMGGALGSLGPIGAIIGAVMGGKALEKSQAGTPFGHALNGLMGPDINQIKEDPMSGMWTAVGLPIVNAFTMNDKAQHASPEWSSLFGG